MAPVQHDFNNKYDRSKFNKLVENIDKDVSHIIYNIIRVKIPIIVEVVTNNAYGNIKVPLLPKEGH
jgi:formiminoglutamase